MSYELRPLSLAEILDAGFRLVQTEWKTLIGLSLIMQAPLIVIAFSLPWLFDPLAQPFENADEVTTEAVLEMAAGLGGVGLAYLILYPFIAAAVTASVGNFYLGRRFALGDAARAGLHSVFRLIAAYIVWLVAYMAIIVVVGGLGAFVVGVAGPVVGDLLEEAGGFGTLIGSLLGIAVVGYLAFWIMFAAIVSSLLAPITVLESHGIFRTVGRAFSLGATSKWRLVGIVFTTGMIVGVPVIGAQMLIGMIPVLGVLVWATLQAVGFAFSTAVTVVLYFDLRCRVENYDIELLAQQVETGGDLGHG